MKITLPYGVGIAFASTLLAFVMFFLGYHNEIEKLKSGQLVSSLGGLLILIVGLTLGMRAVRDNDPAGGLSYGRGVGVGAQISVFAGLVGAVLTLIYATLINPEMAGIVYEAQVAEMEANGMTADQIAGASSMVRFFTSATWMAIANVIFTPLFGTLLSLIIAAFVKRQPVERLTREPDAA